MSTSAPASATATDNPVSPLAFAVKEGLLCVRKRLPAWLFYDAEGSRLFEQITALPEYYLTRAERGIFAANAHGIVRAALDIGRRSSRGELGRLRFLELGAGSAAKTGILLEAAARMQGETEYLPIDVSETALEEARTSLSRALSDIVVRPQVANYVTEQITVTEHTGPTLALYIGSSIGNFNPKDASAILRNLRLRLQPGDSLLLGTDLVKDPATLLAAYNDASGVTANFNLNLLHRLNRELDGDFDRAAFAHEAVWNASASRIEMHLRSSRSQRVNIAALGLRIDFAEGETIHTENSYKFSSDGIASMLRDAGYAPVQDWRDPRNWFAVTLAAAV